MRRKTLNAVSGWPDSSASVTTAAKPAAVRRPLWLTVRSTPSSSHGSQEATAEMGCSSQTIEKGFSRYAMPPTIAADRQSGRARRKRYIPTPPTSSRAAAMAVRPAGNGSTYATALKGESTAL